MDRGCGSERLPSVDVSDGKFSVGFRVIAGEYVDYTELLEKEVGIAGCPRECRKSRKRFDITRSELCDECPRKRQMELFMADTVERWEQWGIEFDFDDMLMTLYQVVSFESLPHELMSVKNSTLASIYRSEKIKADQRAIAAPRGSSLKR
jgi:hypothetical protein